VANVRPAPREPLRWGIVGPGRIVRTQILPGLKRTGAGNAVACASSSQGAAQAAATALGIPKAHAHWQALVEDPDVDVVYVATPNALRSAVVIAAAAAGKHVLCEKPMALTQTEGKAMLVACHSAWVVLRICLQMRLEAVLVRARTLIRGGRIGEVRMISIERMAPLQMSGAWRARRSEGGSILFDVGVHLLDLVPWMLGSEVASMAALSHRDPVEDAPDASLTMLAGMTDGVQAVLRASRELPCAGNDLVVMGTKGMLRTGPLRWVDRHHLTIVDQAGTTEETFPATDLYGEEVTAFAADVRDGGNRLPSGEDGLRLIARAELVEASLRDGGTTRTNP
jgi:1,5-anhydro-D-fructose reductase (1,5-anhydro-D-mannitol-forming)